MAKLYRSQYHNARYCAKERNIDWQFTYDTWIEWWGDDIVNRGPYKGQLVMARNGDIGPYHPDNVTKKTCNENCSEGNKGKIVSEATKNKLRARIPSRGNLGKKLSPESNAKRIASYKATCAKRKEKELA